MGLDQNKEVKPLLIWKATTVCALSTWTKRKELHIQPFFSKGQGDSKGEKMIFYREEMNITYKI